MNKYRHIIFDWDGTLADSISAIVISLQEAGAAIGREISEEAARHIIGMGIDDARRYLLPDLTDIALMKKFHQVYREGYLRREKEIILYDGALDLINRLQQAGKILTIATGKSKEGLQKALENKQLTHIFQAFRTADITKPKPAPDMILELCAETGTDLGETIMIGDTTHDLQMAANAGVAAIGLTHGAHSVESLRRLPHLKLLNSLFELQKEFFV